MKLKGLLALLFIASVLQACGTGPAQTFLNEDKRNAIATVELYNLVIQDEILAEANVKHLDDSLTVKLFSGLLDSTIKTRSHVENQAIISPLYSEIEAWDYRGMVASPYNDLVNKIFSLKNKEVSVEVVLLNQANLDSRVRALKENEALLSLSHHYKFIEDFKQIHTQTTASLYVLPKKSLKYLDAPSEPIYRNTYNYQSNVVGSGGANSIALWAASNAELYKRKIKESIANNTELMSYDLQVGNDESCAKNVYAYLYLPLLSMSSRNAHVIKSENGRLVLRTLDRELFYVEEDALDANQPGQPLNNNCVAK
ncbi:MAG: hypothetical protein ACI9IA_000942 [Enterobacterales bacterium]|jgi:hypothetical protein